MRLLVLVTLLASVPFVFVDDAHAQDDALLLDRISARRDLAIAKNNLRNYWQYDYPRQQRELNFEIEVAEMELRNLNVQLRELRPFMQFSIGRPFPLTVRNLQMCIKAAELRLDNLRAERSKLVRFRGYNFDALAAQIQEARMQVLALEPQESEANELPSPAPPQN
jgi:hypothetical protein